MRTMVASWFAGWTHRRRPPYSAGRPLSRASKSVSDTAPSDEGDEKPPKPPNASALGSSAQVGFSKGKSRGIATALSWVVRRRHVRHRHKEGSNEDPGRTHRPHAGLPRIVHHRSPRLDRRPPRRGARGVGEAGASAQNLTRDQRGEDMSDSGSGTR